MNRLFASLLRIALYLVWGSAVLLYGMMQAPDLVAPVVKGFWDFDIKPLTPYLPIIVFLGPPSFLAATALLRNLLLDYRIDFGTLVWPQQPPKLWGKGNVVPKAYRLIHARCRKRLDALNEQLRADGLAALPQYFMPYGTISEFLRDQPTPAKVEDQKAVLLSFDELPPLGKLSAVAIVGDPGSGKSYALLQQVCARPQVPAASWESVGILPIYLDLADWQKLPDMKLPGTSGGHQLERWVCLFICQEYNNSEPNNAIRPREALWLLHSDASKYTKVVLCLDGLDELPAKAQQECLTAILEYTENGGYVTFTSRQKELSSRVAALPEPQQQASCWFFALPNFTTPAAVDEIIVRHQLGPEVAQPAALADLAPEVHGAAQKKAADLLQCRHEHQMHEYLTTPLLINLFVKVFPFLNSRALAGITAANQRTDVPLLLWAKYEEMKQEQARELYRNSYLGQPKFWLSFRQYLYHIAVQNPTNSFSIDTIQPYKWLGPSFGKVSVALPTTKPAAGAGTRESRPLLTSGLKWYYLTSRLLVGLLLAVAVGWLIARPFSFLGDGVLVGVLAAAFTIKLNYQRRRSGPPVRKRWTHKVYSFIRRRRYVLQVLGFIAVLMLVCGFYEGFTVPRKPGDMQWHGTFSVTQGIFGVIVGLISGIVLGFRRAHTRETDISLVERLGYKWLDAVRIGLAGGAGTGIVVGALGVLLMLFIPDFPATTFGNWLSAYLPNWKQHLGLGTATTLWSDLLAVFSLAFTVAGLVGLVLVSLLAILDRKRSMLQERERNNDDTTHYGVAESIRHGSRSGWRVGILILAILFGIAAQDDGLYLARMRQYLSIGAGASLIAFLWFGGVEFIQHYTLRVHLALLRRLPLRFGQWLFAAREFAFVQGKAGPTIKFLHATLFDYLRLPPGTVPDHITQPMAYHLPLPRWEWRFFRLVLVSLMLTLVALPFIQRWYRVWPATGFWAHPNALALQPTAGVKILNDSTIRILQAGRLHIAVSGKVHVGDIIGSVGPQGTSHGFFGITLDHAYDRFPTANHGAICYRLQQPAGYSAWKPLLPAVPPSFPLPFWNPTLTTTLADPVYPGEYIQFAVNDAEWQNNSGGFTLNFENRALPH